MACEITKTQNQQSSLIELAAMRQTYAEAKRWFAWQFSFSVVPAIGWAIVLLVAPDLKVYAIFSAAVLVLVDNLFFEARQKALLKIAARIQEAFDCNTLCLEWNSVRAGSQTDPEDVNSASNRYKKRTGDVHYRELTNWYRTTLDELPIHQARLLAQRSSVRWDIDLRRKYKGWIVCLTSAVGLLLVCVGLASGQSLKDFIVILLGPWVPALLWGVKEFRKQDATIKRVEELKSHVERAWTDAMSGKVSPEELTHKARALQDEMFQHRSTNTPVFDWAYKRLKNPQEEDMHAAVDLRVNEAKERRQLP